MHRVTACKVEEDYKLWLRFDDGLEGSVFLGNLLEIGAFKLWRDVREFEKVSVDPETATFKVTIEVADPTARLKPGMFARLGIVYERREQALQIPRTAIVDNEDGPTVFVVEDNKAQQRPIRVGLANAGFVEVTAGLKGEEQVVIVGQSGLKSGNAVRVVQLEAAP